MMRWFLLSVLVLLLVGCSAGAQKAVPEKVVVDEIPTVDMTDSLNKLSYATGYKIGDMFQNQKLSIVPDAILKGMYDARKNIRPALTKGEMKMILRDPKKFLVTDVDSLKEKTLREGTAFLSANGQSTGVVVLASGLQYRVLQKGSGKSPQSADIVKVNYTGKNLKGHVFDNAYESGTPAEISVNTFVPGMSEGLQLMKEGAKWEMYVPTSLAYANNGPLAGHTLIFEVELLEVLPAK